MRDNIDGTRDIRDILYVYEINDTCHIEHI